LCGTLRFLFGRVGGVAEILEQLRQENIQLRQQAHYYQSQHERAQEKLRKAQEIIVLLKAKVVELLRRLFGRRSEKRKAESSSASTSTPEKAKQARGQQPGRPGHGRKKHPELPVQKVVVDLPGGTPHCGQCGKPYYRNGTARSYVEIVYEVQFFRRFVACQQYEQTCSCCQPGLPARVTACPPPRLIERGMLSVESIVEGLLRKFLSYMPLQRLIAEWRELGVSISPGTWCGIFARLVPLLEPLVAALLEACRADGQWLMDETRWAVFVHLEGKSSSRWWLWGVVSPRVKLYILSPSRGSGVPQKFFGYDADTDQCRWTGSLMVDRYVSYKFLATLLHLAFCWSHVRRDFVEAQAGAEAEQVAWAQGWIERIGGLYHLNAQRLELGQDRQEPKVPAPFVRMDPQRMATVAYQQAQQALVQGVAEFKAHWQGELAQENLPVRRRKILESLREHWNGLTLFVESPQIPMDNNGAERALRGGAVARKNFYGSGSRWSGELLALMLTIVQTAQVHKVKLRDYLIDYLQACARNGHQAPADLKPWLPWNYRPQEQAAGP
jgi:transposase